MTVGSILEAATQLLTQDGVERLSTNRIAERAGVAVASLYQYFPNKQAILGALSEKELSEERAELTARSAELADRPLREVIRVAVRSTIGIHARRPRLVKSLLESVPVLGAEAHVRARAHVVSMVADALRARSDEVREAPDADMRAFVVVQAVEAAIHAAAAERPTYLDDPAFEDELTALVERYLV
jgi:AcrR family transcriptional regulator